MSFQKDFDELLSGILTDYRNQFPGADTSQGSLIFIRSACLASAVWGIYHFQEWISKQIFADTADTDALEHHAWVRGLSRTYNETDLSLLARYLEYIRRPPAGGNKYDYEKWAKAIDNVSAAYCYPLAQGLGTVDVVIVANEGNTGSEVPSSHTTITGTVTSTGESKLIDTAATFVTSEAQKGDRVTNTSAGTEAKIISVNSETQLTLDTHIFTGTGEAYVISSLITEVKDYIDDQRPVTASVVRVLGPEILSQAVTMTTTGTNVNTAQIAADIEAYMKGLIPGQTLYVSQITAIAIRNGADNATVTTPAGDVVCTDHQMIRPGEINVA
ncbi:MAG: Baseplate J-like protein [Syntrophorhabdus sp. PtaB.Bin047]|nr:MAG: Baseplate J-like protein [Syntrophorhabdus sp. PtaB.Bin047]